MLQNKSIHSKLLQIDTESRFDHSGSDGPPPVDGPHLNSLQFVCQLTNTESMLVVEVDGLNLGGEHQWMELRTHSGHVIDMPLSNTLRGRTEVYMLVPMDTFLPTGTVVVQVVGCDEDGASLRSDSIMIILADNVDVRQKIFEVNSFAVFASGRLRTQLNGFLALVGKALADILSFNTANPKKKLRRARYLLVGRALYKRLREMRRGLNRALL